MSARLDARCRLMCVVDLILVSNGLRWRVKGMHVMHRRRTDENDGAHSAPSLKAAHRQARERPSHHSKVCHEQPPSQSPFCCLSLPIAAVSLLQLPPSRSTYPFLPVRTGQSLPYHVGFRLQTRGITGQKLYQRRSCIASQRSSSSISNFFQRKFVVGAVRRCFRRTGRAGQHEENLLDPIELYARHVPRLDRRRSSLCHCRGRRRCSDCH